MQIWLKSYPVGGTQVGYRSVKNWEECVKTCLDSPVCHTYQFTGGCIKWDSIKWDKTNQRKPKTYAKTLESALTAVSINFSAQKIHKNCCLNVPCILHLKRKILKFSYLSRTVLAFESNNSAEKMSYKHVRSFTCSF